MTQTAIEIHTDGSCKFNPGPGGWAAILVAGQHTRELSGAEPETTNNRMELQAVIAGLSALKAPSQVKVFSDSQYVIDGAGAWMAKWKAKGWKTMANEPLKNADLWQVLDDAAKGHSVDWNWVKGHNGDPLNERADALANKAVSDLIAAGTAPTGEMKPAPAAPDLPFASEGSPQRQAAATPADLAARAGDPRDAEIGKLRALLTESLGAMTHGLPASLFIEHAPDCLVSRIAKACEG